MLNTGRAKINREKINTKYLKELLSSSNVTMKLAKHWMKQSFH